MLGMTQNQTAFILFFLILFGTMALVSIVQEIGKTRRAKHEADKARIEAATEIRKRTIG